MESAPAPWVIAPTVSVVGVDATPLPSKAKLPPLRLIAWVSAMRLLLFVPAEPEPLPILRSPPASEIGEAERASAPLAPLSVSVPALTVVVPL